jgi:hypothetical protein
MPVPEFAPKIRVASIHESLKRTVGDYLEAIGGFGAQFKPES